MVEELLRAHLTMLTTAAEDVAGRRPPPEDPLDARDPEYIRATLPALRATHALWFRGEVRGLERIPEGPCLLVGNHSGGTLIADTFVLAQAFYDHFGPERTFHQLAHDLVFKVPGVRSLLTSYGTVPANPDNMRRALARDAALLVYPGGDEESYRPSWESSKVDFAGRKGFARLARELDVPVVPVVAIGGQETALFLGRGRRIARLLGLDKAMRLKVFPTQLAPPFGLTVLDLPARVPLPAKITVEVLDPMDLREADGPDEAYDLVTGRMQRALDGLADERTLPVLG
jgi:1-acyl-sn-glycerol-3-phosphate acyltransferase